MTIKQQISYGAVIKLLDMLYLLMNQSFMRNEGGKIELQRNLLRRICLDSLFWLHALLPMYFLYLFLLTPCLSSTPIVRRKNFLFFRKLGVYGPVLTFGSDLNEDVTCA